jgi:hypothetical protein
MRESFSTGELDSARVFSNDRHSDYGYNYVQNLIGSDILAEGCNAQKKKKGKAIPS